YLEHHVLIPGLINCHTHVAMTLLRGFADDLELMDWLDHYICPAEKRFLSKDYITLGTQMGVYEMLKT
ncbi:hypothetical protein Pmar_PMAR027672, partial [Perkinsus marinus ATCC 50983]